MFSFQVIIYLSPLFLWPSFIFILSWFRCNHHHCLYWSFPLWAKDGTGLLLNTSCDLELFRITEEELELNDRNCQRSLESGGFHPMIMAESWLKELKIIIKLSVFPLPCLLCSTYFICLDLRCMKLRSAFFSVRGALSLEFPLFVVFFFNLKFFFFWVYGWVVKN